MRFFLIIWKIEVAKIFLFWNSKVFFWFQIFKKLFQNEKFFPSFSNITVHLNKKNLSNNYPWDFDTVLDTIDPNWFYPDENFCSQSAGCRWCCNSLKQLFTKELQLKIGHHFQAKKLLLPLNSVSVINLGCTMLEIKKFCH